MSVNLRRKQNKIMKLSLLVTKLNYMKSKDLRCVLNIEIDVVNILKKYMTEKQKSDKKEENEKHQTVFMMKCYKQLISKYKEYNAQFRNINSNLLQIVKEKNVVYFILQIAFTKLQFELYLNQIKNERIVEMIEINMIIQTFVC